MRMPLALLPPAAALLLLAAGTGLGAETPPAEYLSGALAERLVSVAQGWGELGLNTSVKPAQKPALKLRIKEKEYEHGLGHHAPGEIVVDLDGQFKTFLAEVGVQWQGGTDQASVIFRVFVDDKKVFDSGVMRENDPARQVNVSVHGASELRLVADDAGDGITCDCANWADARLVPDPDAARAPAAGVDVGPFGRVATWDPKQLKGTQAKRTEEFPAEDLYPAQDLAPGDDGAYRVPVREGVGCIGLQWDENRLLRRVVLEFAGSAPAPGAVQLQAWTGESAWQGAWQPMETAPENIEGALVWALGYKELPRGTQKVRWLFPGIKEPVLVKALSAYTRSGWGTLDVRVQSVGGTAGPKAEIELYNGVILDPAGAPCRRTWDPASPLVLKVRYSLSKRYKADRTVLRFQSPDAAFGVAVEDLAAHDCVYVPHAGLFVTRDPAPVAPDEYLKSIAGRKTVLQQVREKPDQTFAQAMAVVHNPVQNLGPTMISLACDNRKFVVHREGTVVFDRYGRPDEGPRPIPDQWQLVPRFGSAKDPQIARKLRGGWLPMPVTTVTEGSVAYRQTAYVAPVGEPAADAPAWLRDRALGVVEYEVANQGAEPAGAALALALAAAKQQPVEVKEVKEGALVVSGERVVALVDARGAAPLAMKVEAAGVVLSGPLPAGATARCAVYVPAWKLGPAEYDALAAATPWAAQTETYWKGLLEPAMQVELPDPLLTDVVRASQVHCLLAARNEARGARVSAWISSDRYGPLESEAHAVIRGMDMMGHADFARRSLEYFIARYNKAGFLTTGYTVVGTGEHLWTLAEHHERTADRAWLERAAPELARVCAWIVRQRAKTMRTLAGGRKAPEYGLMPPGVTADWNRYAYRFFNDAQYCAGLEGAARVLAEVGHPDAPKFLAEAGRYREDLARAYRWTRARSPAVRLDSGAWVPADPAILDCFGRVEDFLPGEDWNRSWAYSIEIGAHHLAATGVVDPASEEAGWMMDYLEDVQLLRSGMGDYPEEKNRQDVFNFGGFAKVQPYYARIAEVYALRDDVKPFVRSYFNAIPTLLSLENLSFWEHFHNRGGWNKTHETGWFLCQTRIMLVQERGDELWLAPLATSAWLKDGMKLSVRNAPTRFGNVSYTIASSAAQGRIEAAVEAPGRTPPARIVLRLRHPEGKAIRAVTVNGKAHKEFDPKQETVTLAPGAGPVRVEAQY